MPGFSSIAEYVDAQLEGRFYTTHLRKIPSQTTVAGWWYDFSMAAGFPRPQYYAATPQEASVLTGAYGIYHGADKSPASKHLTTLRLQTPTAAMVGQYILQDYLLFYPFIDCDSLELQEMDNFGETAGAAALPRYTNGIGNQVMAVVVAPTTGSGVFTFTYKNQAGVTKTSPTQGCTTTAANIGSLLGSQQSVANCFGPYLALAAGDTGVTSIESVTFTVPNGGLAAFVIAHPLTDTVIREINTERELEFMSMRPGPPRIYDGAYLNYIANVAGTVAAGTLVGSAQFAWSN
jgi:hypothetical protein